jgi:hypothetical protein
MFIILIIGLVLGWASPAWDKIPKVKAVDAWVRAKLSVWF